MPTHLYRSSRAISLGVAASLVVAAAAWPAPAQAPRDNPAANRKEDRPDLKTAPDRSRGASAGEPGGKMPPGARILLERRRAEVREREAAWAAKRREVEQHLADILAHPREETRKDEAEFTKRRLEREVAEIAVKEYEQGISVQERQTLSGEVKLAEGEVIRREDQLESSKKGFEQGNLSRVQLNSDQLNFEKAKYTLEQAKSKLKVLDEYTKPKRLFELKQEVEKARAEELSKQAAWELAKRREDTLAARSRQLGSPLTEAHIAALLDEAASLQAKVVQLLTRAQQSEKTDGLTAEQARLHAETMQKAIAQARSHEDAARAKLGEALALSRLVQTWREELRDTEAGLHKARADLERLERMMNEP
jgi:hypothetical protein